MRCREPRDSDSSSSAGYCFSAASAAAAAAAVAATLLLTTDRSRIRNCVSCVCSVSATNSDVSAASSAGSTAPITNSLFARSSAAASSMAARVMPTLVTTRCRSSLLTRSNQHTLGEQMDQTSCRCCCQCRLCQGCWWWRCHLLLCRFLTAAVAVAASAPGQRQ